MAEVGAFPQHNPIVGTQTPGCLAVAHIDAVNTSGTVLQQAIGETAGGDAAIEADAILHPHRKSLQAGQEFFSTPGNEAGGLFHPQFPIRHHFRSGLIKQGSGTITHLARADQLLRLLP